MTNTMYLLAGTLIAISCFSGCSKKTTVDSFYAYKAECLGVGLDGSQSLRVWGTGRTESEARQQARKNALHEILFKGITAGKTECSVRPLMLEVNAEEKYEDYFISFFNEEGAYARFVSEENPKKKAIIKQNNKQQVKCGIVVKVQRNELKSELEKDGILKSR